MIEIKTTNMVWACMGTCTYVFVCIRPRPVAEPDFLLITIQEILLNRVTCQVCSKLFGLYWLASKHLESICHGITSNTQHWGKRCKLQLLSACWGSKAKASCLNSNLIAHRVISLAPSIPHPCSPENYSKH